MNRREPTEMGGNAYEFLTTQWSLIEDIQEGDEDGALIARLMELYWKPAYCYLRRRGLDNEEAKDITQGFFHEIVLNRSLADRADREKGRFRVFLLHALKQYHLSERSRDRAQKRYPKGGFVDLSTDELETLPKAVSLETPEDTYHYVWLSGLLERVLSEVEEDCRKSGLSTHWSVFVDRIIEPSLGNASTPSLTEICKKYAIESEKTASNMAITVKRRFQTALRKHVRSTVTKEADISHELNEILRFLH